MGRDDRDADDRWRRLLQLLSPIHQRSRQTARRLCLSNADGDDLFQEAVLRAFARLDDLRDEQRFRYWFYAVLLSVHRQRCRRHFWQRLVPLFGVSAAPPDERPLSDCVATSSADPEESCGQAQRLIRLLAALSAAQREAIVLFEIDGYTISEIAQMQGESISAVKSQLSRGRERLRQAYQELDRTPAAAGSAASAGKEELRHGRRQTAVR